jgi:hypothetical protein
MFRFQRVMDFEDSKVKKPETKRVLERRGRVVESMHGNETARILIGIGRNPARSWR